MNTDYDLCVIGSGPGGASVAYTLSQAGYSVLVLEKGPWFKEKDFVKDELLATRRDIYTPNLKDERHVIEKRKNNEWQNHSTYDTGSSFWNGNCVGGSSNFMSGFFHKMKEEDFKLHSIFGKIENANIQDWPISYKDLAPYYSLVENIIGVSGEHHPYPPSLENGVTQLFDSACNKLNFSYHKVARAILTRPKGKRKPCYYSDYCGNYGCYSGAKGSARAALLDEAVETGKCTIKPRSMVFKLESDSKGNVTAVYYYDSNNKINTVKAKIFVVACQSIETSRLLLLSKGIKHPDGLANNNGQVGKNLVFSAGGSGSGTLKYKNYNEDTVEEIKKRGLFVNRSLDNWYFIDKKYFGKRLKGGLVEFMFQHSNPISRANSVKWSNNKLIWGDELKNKLKSTFTEGRNFRFEIFCDWLPNDNCFVTLDNKVKDKWGNPVAKIRVGYHKHDIKIGEFLAEKSKQVLQQMKAENISSYVSGAPPPNLVAGGCRFGNDPTTSVLDKNCKAHDVDNLYITDASFMPTGGSIPYTWTIYANSFRVADAIKKQI